MAHFWQHLKSGARSGQWLTVSRARAYSLILLGICAVAFAGWIALSDGLIDRNGKPIGTDFSNPYAAGTLAWAGKPADAYDPALQHAAEKAVFGNREVPFFGWHYPPFFFAIAAIVAAVPYGWGLFIWLATSLAAYLAAIRAIVPTALPGDIGSLSDPISPGSAVDSCVGACPYRRTGFHFAGTCANPETWLVALAFPAVLVNIGHGQNGFLTAALLGGALHWLDRRPWLAGVLVGLLAYKPQFGVLIPLALLANGRWSSIGAAAATVAALVAVSYVTLGSEVWHAFANSTTFTRTVVLEQGGTGWEKIQSIFSAARMWGAGVHTAYAAQIALALVLAVSIVRLWHSDAAFDLKASALATASLLATPYVLDYDLVVLAVSIAFFARHGLACGFRDYEISLLAAAWVMPLFSRGIMGASGIPLGLLVMLGLYAATLRRAAMDRSQSTVPAGRVAQA
jgi:hypothetical protein